LASENDGDRPAGSGRSSSILLIFTGTLLIIFSILHIARLILGPTRFLERFNVGPDIIAGGILFLEGSLLIVGGYKLIKGREEGVAFAWIGWIVGLLLSSVSALVLLSNAFSSVVLSVEGMEDWSATSDVVPALYLGLVLIFLLPLLANLGSRSGPIKKGRSRI